VRSLVASEILSALLQLISKKFKELGVTRLATNIKISLFRSVLAQDVETFDSGPDQYHYIQIFMKTHYTIKSLIAIPTRVLSSVVTVATSAAMLYSASPRLLMMMGGALVARDTISEFLGLLFRELNRKLAHRIADPDYLWYAPLLKEWVRTMRSLSRERTELARYEQEQAAEQKEQAAHALCGSIHLPFATALHEGYNILGFVLIGQFVMKEGLPPGNLYSFNGQVESMVSELQSLYSLLKGDDGDSPVDSAVQIIDTMDYHAKIGLFTPPYPSPGACLASGGLHPSADEFEGKIEVRDVSFSYPNKPGQQILEGLNMTIEAGTMVGLMGESGSGKSTLFQLLQRFYDPTEGGIFLDGRDIREYNPMWLREQIAVVTQV
jgi:ABC-type multidrug transport system fused ATPase/permease subunit